MTEPMPAIEGKPELHPEGNYYLRFMRNGKRVWQAIGPEVDAAVTAVQNLEFETCLATPEDRLQILPPV